MSLLSSINNAITEQAQLEAAQKEEARQLQITQLTQSMQDVYEQMMATSQSLTSVRDQLANTDPLVLMGGEVYEGKGRGEGTFYTRPTYYAGNPDYPELQAQETSLASQIAAAEAELATIRNAVRNLGGVPSYDVGTDYHPGGLAYVHQDEMINLPRGSSVSTTSQTSKMLDNTAVIEELRALRQEVARLRSENNQGHQNTRKETERGATVLRKFDQTGMPPEREPV